MRGFDSRRRNTNLQKITFLWNCWFFDHQVISGKHGQFYARNRFNHYDKKVDKIDIKGNWRWIWSQITPCLLLWLLTIFGRGPNCSSQFLPGRPGIITLSSFHVLFTESASQKYLISFSVPEEVVLCPQLWATYAEGEDAPAIISAIAKIICWTNFWLVLKNWCLLETRSGIIKAMLGFLSISHLLESLQWA